MKIQESVHTVAQVTESKTKEIVVIHLNENNDTSIVTFLGWMSQHFLGRKRILDTMLAATFREEQIASILTTNAHDFAVLGGFACVTP